MASKNKARVVVPPPQPQTGVRPQRTEEKLIFKRNCLIFLLFLIQQLTLALPLGKTSSKGQHPRQLLLCDMTVDRSGISFTS